MPVRVLRARVCSSPPRNHLAMTTQVCGHVFSFLWCIYLGAELLGHMVTAFEELPYCKMIVPFCVSNSREQLFQFLHILSLYLAIISSMSFFLLLTLLPIYFSGLIQSLDSKCHLFAGDTQICLQQPLSSQLQTYPGLPRTVLVYAYYPDIIINSALMYQFPTAAVMYYYQLSGLSHTTLLFYSYGDQKSDAGVTGLKSRCLARPHPFMEAVREALVPGSFRLLAEFKSLCL